MPTATALQTPSSPPPPSPSPSQPLPHSPPLNSPLLASQSLCTAHVSFSEVPSSAGTEYSDAAACATSKCAARTERRDLTGSAGVCRNYVKGGEGERGITHTQPRGLGRGKKNPATHESGRVRGLCGRFKRYQETLPPWCKSPIKRPRAALNVLYGCTKLVAH